MNKEIRDAIARGHQLRSDNTEPSALVQQTERNIANKQRAIDRAKGKIDELKAQRDEIDASILAEEAKLKNEIDLLETFKTRLKDAQDRKKASDAPKGVCACELDKEVGKFNTVNFYFELTRIEAENVNNGIKEIL